MWLLILEGIVYIETSLPSTVEVSFTSQTTELLIWSLKLS